MSDHADDDRGRELKTLRDQIARLISQNLELQRQIEDLKREKADIAIASLAAVAVRSTRAAEEAIAQEVPEGNRYHVSELHMTYRGLIVPGGEQLALRLPLPEHAVPSGHLSALDMTIAQVPPPVSAAPETRPKPAYRRLVQTLEKVQAVYASWAERRGAAAAAEIVSRATCLLDIHPRWEAGAMGAELAALADAARRFRAAQASRLGPDLSQDLRLAIGQLRDHARTLVRTRTWSPGDLERLADALNRVAQIE